MALFPPFSLLPYPLSLSFPSFRLLDLCVYYTMDEGFFSFLIISLYLLLVCVRLASMIDRSEWMYGLDRVNDPRYLDEVRKFITVAKRHRERLKRIATICPCSRCKNLKAYSDPIVQSHLIMYGFVKDYTV